MDRKLLQSVWKVIEAFKKYTALGLSCLPTKEDKTPYKLKSWLDECTESNFVGAYGIGIKCGIVSGGLEVLDFDNHQGDAKDNLTKYIEHELVNPIYVKYSLPIEKTQGGGYHVMYRCSKIDGNRKLASRFVTELGRPDAFIETKGEGGYVCVDPTPGYKVVKNDICSIPTITDEERDMLINVAKSMNEFAKIVKTEYETGEKAGNRYNESMNAGSEAKDLLRSNGWKERGKYWTRPGKDEGISASFGVCGPNIFYCFTANGSPFEENGYYTPFAVLTMLKFGGDFKKAAQSMPPSPEYLARIKGADKPVMEENELDRILSGAKIDTSKPIEYPPTILSIREAGSGQFNMKRLFTLGNFSVIIGKAKSKKTFLLTKLTASLIKDDDKFVSGFKSTGKKLLLWFDTEQGEYDSYNCIRRIERMAGSFTGMLAFNLRPYSPMERCQIIEYAFQKFGESIGYCVIDGIADLANGINDEDEATRVSTLLLRLTKVHNCHMSIVIHQNKNDNFATGHLGSALMKKAEIIISVAKNTSDKRVADVNCDLSRGVDFEPFSFTISQDGLPEVCEFTKTPPKSYFDKEEPMEPITPHEEIPF